MQQNPEDGFALIDVAGSDADVTGSVIRGWSRSDVTEDLATEILDRLLQSDIASVAADIAQMLAAGGQSQATPTEWHRLQEARRLAREVWDTLDRAAPVSDHSEDWLLEAINDPAGRLAEFWTHAVAADWRTAADTWTGLPDTTREDLERLLAAPDRQGAMAEIIIAARLQFFSTADPNWCDAHVLPLLNWTDAARARRTWSGFLIWGRWNDHLLATGLLQEYLSTVGHVAELRADLAGRVALHLAGVALSSQLDAIAWARQFTATADVPMRVDWLRQIAWALDSLPSEARARQWDRWMRAYWQGRLDSVPVEMTMEEASVMAAWPLHLPEVLEAAVALATAHPARLNVGSTLLGEVGEHLDQGAQYARLLAHLLRYTERPFWGCDELAELVPQLRSNAASSDINVIIEEALRLGCQDAPSW